MQTTSLCCTDMLNALRQLHNSKQKQNKKEENKQKKGEMRQMDKGRKKESEVSGVHLEITSAKDISTFHFSLYWASHDQ